jgi:hypothetical protein
MKNTSVQYKDTTVFAVLIQPNLVSVHAQLNDGKEVSPNIYEEFIYRTDNLQAAINTYITKYLSKGKTK